VAGEIATSFQAGRSLYCQIRNRTSGYVYNGSTFESYSSNSGNIASYAVNMTEQGTASAYYTANFPSAIGPGIYDVIAKQKVQTPYLESDPTVSVGEINWNGSIVVPLSNLVTSGQLSDLAPMRIARGTMVQNFPFKMVSSIDHITPFTSGVVSGQISRDGAAFTTLQSGLVTEIGLGFYKTTLTSGDLLANTIALHFTCAGISGGTADSC